MREARAWLADAGAVGWVHARPVDAHPDEVVWQADEAVPMASLYKLVVAAAWAHRVAAGEIDPRARLLLPAATRVGGPTGVATLLDDVDLSSRDGVRLMLTVSDNALGDALLDLVGRASVAEVLQAAGAARAVVRHASGAAQLRVQRDTGTNDLASSMRALADLDDPAHTAEYDPALASAASARDLTALLVWMWQQPTEAMALVRTAMSQQVWRHRIGSGFPHDDVVVAAKSATLGTLRHEVAVVHFPGEVPVAVAVLTRAVRAERHVPALDAAVGRVARAAVEALRRREDT